MEWIDRVIRDLENAIKKEKKDPNKDKIFRDIEILEICINLERNPNKKIKLIQKREELIKKL